MHEACRTILMPGLKSRQGHFETTCMGHYPTRPFGMSIIGDADGRMRAEDFLNKVPWNNIERGCAPI